jgi:hypothetical protein
MFTKGDPEISEISFWDAFAGELLDFRLANHLKPIEIVLIRFLQVDALPNFRYSASRRSLAVASKSALSSLRCLSAAFSLSSYSFLGRFLSFDGRAKFRFFQARHF